MSGEVSRKRGVQVGTPLRAMARETLSRVAGAPLVGGNEVELLIDARANFDAWLEAIRGARSSILLENYIIADDDVSRELRAALAERAAAGVQVCVVRDWLGCLGESGEHFWNELRAAGGEVRTYNPLHLSSPLGWLSRDHRKLLVVDTTSGFISGVCISAKWLGNKEKGVAPWRDTGVRIRGPALRELVMAFAESWARLGEALPDSLPALHDEPATAGDVDLRVIATLPSTTGIYRLDQMIAAVAQHSLWLTDAYFVGTAAYVQSLVGAARDGVDVRLLVPGTSDLPGVGALSRSGYRVLLEAGIRVYEWNGSMLHAKSAVADGRWGRIGSSNLNIASWMGNCEIDVSIENAAFAQRMQAQYEEDLLNSTEIVLAHHQTVRRKTRKKKRRRAAGSSRAAAGAIRVANTVGAAITDRRVLVSGDRRVLFLAAFALVLISVAIFHWPRLLSWPVALFALWAALSLLARAFTSRRQPEPAPKAARSDA